VAKFAIIDAIPFAIIMALYEFVVRRFNVLRVLIGMKPLRSQQAEVNLARSM
jgi:hypothetical protein